MKLLLALAIVGSLSVHAWAAAGFVERRGTQLVDNGKPVHLVSVNKYNLFWGFILGGEREQESRHALASAKEAGFTVIRTSAAPFWPVDARQWARGDAFWAAADRAMAAAKENGIRYILTVDWNWQVFPDLAGETMQDCMTDRTSRSWQMLALFTSQLVGRYKDDPTIFMWELSNELNLGADLEFMRPFGWQRNNGQPLDLGTPVAYVARDNYRSAQMNLVAVDLAKLIRSVDRNHLIGSGYSVPRPAAWHLKMNPAKGDWTLDTQEQTLEMLREYHADPIDCISVHIYPGDMEHWGYKGDAPRIVRTFKALADKIGKPLYIGETGDARPRLPFTGPVLRAAMESGVPLTLIWQWDSPGDRENNYTAETEPEVVKLMQELNRAAR